MVLRVANKTQSMKTEAKPTCQKGKKLQLRSISSAHTHTYAAKK